MTARTVEQATVRTDYDERVCVSVDERDEIMLSLDRLVRPGCTWERTDEAVLRPSQAERLAADLLAFANGDHKLPPDAIRPRRIVEEQEMPHTSVYNGGPVCWCGDTHGG